ncbi:MAG: peptide-methionine (R)-S-oxide reductase MsrB [Wenzhouxiangellaceae bacterium]
MTHEQHSDEIDPRSISDDEWRRQLSPQAYAVTRQGATEAPFSGEYDQHDEAGVYQCVCCHAPLFASTTKFNAGCGWPSFYAELAGERIKRLADNSHGMRRIEIRCARCDAHLGHVFDDGPQPTGERYCVNSVALEFVPGAPDPATA